MGSQSGRPAWRATMQNARQAGRFFVCGGVADGTRTHDHRNHNPGLYQLSYSHRRDIKYSLRLSTVQSQVLFFIDAKGVDRHQRATDDAAAAGAVTSALNCLRRAL